MQKTRWIGRVINRQAVLISVDGLIVSLKYVVRQGWGK